MCVCVNRHLNYPTLCALVRLRTVAEPLFFDATQVESRTILKYTKYYPGKVCCYGNDPSAAIVTCSVLPCP